MIGGQAERARDRESGYAAGVGEADGVEGVGNESWCVRFRNEGVDEGHGSIIPQGRRARRWKRREKVERCGRGVSDGYKWWALDSSPGCAKARGLKSPEGSICRCVRSREALQVVRCSNGRDRNTGDVGWRRRFEYMTSMGQS